MRYSRLQRACPTRDPRSLTLSPRQTFLLIFSLRSHAWSPHADLPGVAMLLQRIWQGCVSSGVTWLARFNGRAGAATIFSISLTWHELTHHGRSGQDAGGLKRPMLDHCATPQRLEFLVVACSQPSRDRIAVPAQG